MLLFCGICPTIASELGARASGLASNLKLDLVLYFLQVLQYLINLGSCQLLLATVQLPNSNKSISTTAQENSCFTKNFASHSLILGHCLTCFHSENSNLHWVARDWETFWRKFSIAGDWQSRGIPSRKLPVTFALCCPNCLPFRYLVTLSLLLWQVWAFFWQDLVHLPEGFQTLDCRWQFQVWLVQLQFPSGEASMREGEGVSIFKYMDSNSSRRYFQDWRNPNFCLILARFDCLSPWSQSKIYRPKLLEYWILPNVL